MQFGFSWPSATVLVAVATFVGALGATPAFAGGDAAAGQAQAAVCGACHGADGATGIDPTYPNLAGQNEAYMLAQLQMIKSGNPAGALPLPDGL